MPRKHHNTTEPNVIHEDLILDVVADVRSRDRDRLAARHLAASSAIDRQHREPVGGGSEIDFICILGSWASFWCKNERFMSIIEGDLGR
jgi:hypothetical protein